MAIERIVRSLPATGDARILQQGKSQEIIRCRLVLRGGSFTEVLAREDDVSPKRIRSRLRLRLAPDRPYRHRLNILSTTFFDLTTARVIRYLVLYVFHDIRLTIASFHLPFFFFFFFLRLCRSSRDCGP